MIVTQKMFGYCGGLRAVSLFVNRSAMFIEAVFKSTFGFSYLLFNHHIDCNSKNVIYMVQCNHCHKHISRNNI